MKGPFDNLPEYVEKEISKKWKNMEDEERKFFINQLALFLSVVGNDRQSKDIIAILFEKLVKSNSKFLTELPKHLKWFVENGGAEIYKEKEKELKRVLKLLEFYDLKKSL